MKKDVVDIILSKKYDKATKIIRLWMVVQLNYRQPLGDKAWGGINKLTDKDTTTALSFLTGFSAGIGMKPKRRPYSRQEILEGLVPELKEL